MGKELSQEEIRQRLVRLNNVERLHREQKATIALLRKENKELKEKLASRDKIIEDLKLQIEELEIKVYGKKKDRDNNDDNPEPPKEEVIRTKESYQRPVPKEEEITETRRHRIELCPDCGAETINKETAVFYEEDIPIAVKKIVIKHEVEKGYCPCCKAWHQTKEFPGAKVILGPNIQKYICYLSSVCRLSFSCVQSLLQSTYQIKVSQGEISKILERESMHLLPFYEKLKEKIRSEPIVHMDETSWKVFKNKASSYAWTMCGSISKEKVFILGKTRGGGNTEDLVGKDYRGVVVSDDYGAYDKFPRHQLCWAHLFRKFRDLAGSNTLAEDMIDYCKAEYEKLCRIFNAVKSNRTMEKYDEFVQKLTDFSKFKENEPKKMIRFKKTLRDNIEKYLTCLKDSNIPMTNNLAEQSLRHLVIKRKISFGSLNERTAHMQAILLSVLMSLKQRYGADFFMEYLKV
jgi:hypothetical protein